MNKKFSTLVAALLLSGALFTVDAAPVGMDAFVSSNSEKVSLASGVMEFTGDVTLSNYQDYLLIDQDNVTIEGNGRTLNGRIVVTGKGVTIRNLIVNFDNAAPAQGSSELGSYDPTIAINKTAIAAYTDGLTITGCKIYCSSKNWIANAITVYPKSTSAKIEISNNEVYNAKQVKDEWAASAIMIIEGFDPSNSGFAGATTSGVLEKKPVVSGNKYTECLVDYAYANFGESTPYKEIQISPLKDDSNIDDIAEYFNGAIENAKLVFTGTAAQLQEALGENFTTTANVAVQCSDGNILFGNAANPNNGQAAIVGDVKALDAEIAGSKLLKENDGKANLLILKGTDGANYVVSIVDGAPYAAMITNDNPLSGYMTNKAALWTMTENTDPQGKVYYSFKNQEDVLLAIANGDEYEKKGMLYPVNEGAKYNSGVVFALNGND